MHCSMQYFISFASSKLQKLSFVNVLRFKKDKVKTHPTRMRRAISNLKLFFQTKMVHGFSCDNHQTTKLQRVSTSYIWGTIQLILFSSINLINTRCISICRIPSFTCQFSYQLISCSLFVTIYRFWYILSICSNSIVFYTFSTYLDLHNLWNLWYIPISTLSKPMYDLAIVERKFEIENSPFFASNLN